MTTHFTAGMGALWAQVDGPNTQPVYLGCHQLGDIEVPFGDVELIYCPDPSGPNRFKVVGSVQGAAGSVTASVTTDVTDDLDDLETANCPFPIYVHMIKSGLKNVFTNYDRTFILTGSRVTSASLTNLAGRTPDDNTRSEQTFELSAESLIRYILLTITKQTQATVPEAANDITFCNDERCRTDEEAAQALCQTGFVCFDADGIGGTAEIMATTNGATWAATSADPLGADEHAISIECFQLGRDTIRVLVANGTTNAAAPPEVAYSDDSGATWTIVALGSTNSLFVATRHSLFALDRDNIWVGLDNGIVYKSTDAGLTYTLVAAATVLAGSCNAIHFADATAGWIGGAGGAIAKSVDGGVSWEAVSHSSASDIICLFAHDRNRVWTGHTDGTLWYTEDAGVTWAQRSFSGTGVGDVMDIEFLNDHIGYMVRNNASPVGQVQVTIDGGYTWEAMTTPTNSGLNTVFICDTWNFYVVGEANASFGVIAKAGIA